jgi:hypothetical protein
MDALIKGLTANFGFPVLLVAFAWAMWMAVRAALVKDDDWYRPKWWRLETPENPDKPPQPVKPKQRR